MSTTVGNDRQISIAKQKKETGDQAFKSGETKDALRSYHEALMYLEGLNKNAMQAMSGSAVDQAAGEKPRTEVDELVEKIYSNMSACHLKNGNWKRTIETADKAIAKNDRNFKALFRKAKALGETGHFERAQVILIDLLGKNTTDAPAINAELTRLRAIDKVREKAHNKKLKGFLNRDKNEKSGIVEIVDEPQKSGIVEIVDDPN